MSSEEFGLTIRSVAELALVVSRAGDQLLDEGTIPTTAALRAFWQSSRRLQQRWLKVVDQEEASVSRDWKVLERLASRVFVCEMLVRTWSTVLASLDRRRGTEDLTSVARNIVIGLLQIRHRVLGGLLLCPPSEKDRVMEIDLLRRRCDRWTDLLLGQLAVKQGCLDFAFDPERARDFGEESQFPDAEASSPAFDHLMSAGLRMAFLQHLPTEILDEPEFVALMRAILSCCSPNSFDGDRALCSMLGLRLAATEHRREMNAGSWN